jgi:hypothetical protein
LFIFPKPKLLRLGLFNSWLGYGIWKIGAFIAGFCAG